MCRCGHNAGELQACSTFCACMNGRVGTQVDRGMLCCVHISTAGVRKYGSWQHTCNMCAWQVVRDTPIVCAS